MEQNVINWLVAGLGAIMGALLRTLWGTVQDLQKADKELAEKVGQIEILVAGDYLKKDDFRASMEAIFRKLDKIEEKLDKKVDK